MKSQNLGITTPKQKSHPARGAWIEISKNTFDTFGNAVAPRKGCVD